MRDGGQQASVSLGPVGWRQPVIVNSDEFRQGRRLFRQGRVESVSEMESSRDTRVYRSEITGQSTVETEGPTRK